MYRDDCTGYFEYFQCHPPAPFYEFGFGDLSFALFVTIATACLFALPPALSTSRAQLNTALQTNRRNHTGGTEHRAAKAFIIAQLSVSLVLIAGASLLVRSFWNIFYQDWGYRRDRILIMDLAYDPQTLTIELSPAFREALQQRLSAIPGIISAAFASEGPLGEMFWQRDVALPDWPPEESDRALFIQVSLLLRNNGYSHHCRQADHRK